MRLPSLLLLTALANAPAVFATTVQIHFDELGTGSAVDANNQHLLGVLFQFSGGTAQYNGVIGSAGNAALVSDPALIGPTSGTLSLTFDSPTTIVAFDIAMESIDPISAAYTVSLPGNAPLSGDTAPILMFSEGHFQYDGSPISSATITFSNAAPEFALDNLTFGNPEPGTSLLLGGAFLGLALFGRRNRRR